MLARSGEITAPCPVPRLEPFLDLTDDALIADPVLHEPDQPFLAHRVEERLDVGVQYEVHLPAGNPDTEGVVRRPARTEPVREPEEVFLVDRVQDRGRRPLDYFVSPSTPGAALSLSSK